MDFFPLAKLATAARDNPGYWKWSTLGFQVDRASWQIWTVTRALGLYTRRTQHGGMIHILPNRCDDNNACTRDRWKPATRKCEYKNEIDGSRRYYAGGSFPFGVAGPTGGNSASCSSWRGWFRHGAGKQFRVSPGCGKVAASGEVYRMTGNFYGCKWYNRNCDMTAGDSCRVCKDNWHPNT